MPSGLLFLQIPFKSHEKNRQTLKPNLFFVLLFASSFLYGKTVELSFCVLQLGGFNCLDATPPLVFCSSNGEVVREGTAGAMEQIMTKSGDRTRLELPSRCIPLYGRHKNQRGGNGTGGAKLPRGVEFIMAPCPEGCEQWLIQGYICCLTALLVLPCESVSLPNSFDSLNLQEKCKWVNESYHCL